MSPGSRLAHNPLICRPAKFIPGERQHAPIHAAVESILGPRICLTAADINARNVAPSPITMTEIQGSRDARLAHTVALIGIRPHTLSRESIASSVTLKTGAVANVSIDARRLLQSRCFSAVGLGHKEACSTGFQDLLRTLHGCQKSPHIRRMHPPSVVHSWSRRTRARIRSAPIRGASDVACLPGRRERLPLPEVRALAVAPKVRRCSVCPIAAVLLWRTY